MKKILILIAVVFAFLMTFVFDRKPSNDEAFIQKQIKDIHYEGPVPTDTYGHGPAEYVVRSIEPIEGTSLFRVQIVRITDSSLFAAFVSKDMASGLKLGSNVKALTIMAQPNSFATTATIITLASSK